MTNATSNADVRLPPLPEPAHIDDIGYSSNLAYSAQQMESYALEAVRAYARDAHRYRWLRDHAGSYESGIYEDNGFGGQSLKYAEELDAAIDSARA